MKPRTMDWAARLARWALLAAAGAAVAAYVAAVALRIRYPFGLEWMEGAMVDHVRWLLAGHALYGAPSLDFVPYNYPPLYFYLSAAVSAVLGVGFLPLRLVSVLASLGCLALIYALVARETSSRFAAALAACLFAATYRAGGAWLDLARIDSLFLLETLGLLWLVRFGRSARAAALAGVLAAAAFLTKQSAVLVVVPLMVYAIVDDRRRGLVFAGTAAAFAAGSTLLLDALYGGWLSYYLFRVASHHAIIPSMVLGFWWQDLLGPLPVASVLGLLFLVSQLSRAAARRALFYLLACVGTVGAAWGSRVHAGAYVNVVIPAYAMVSVLFGLAVHRALGFARAAAEGRRRAAEIALYALCLTQFGLLAYNPLDVVPKRSDLEAGRHFLATVAAIQGEVYIPTRGYLAALAGKATGAHATAVADVLNTGGPAARDLERQFLEALRAKRYRAIIRDEHDETWSRETRACYAEDGRIFDDPRAFRPMTGHMSRPDTIFVPKADLPQ